MGISPSIQVKKGKIEVFGCSDCRTMQGFGWPCGWCKARARCEVLPTSCHARLGQPRFIGDLANLARCEARPASHWIRGSTSLAQHEARPALHATHSLEIFSSILFWIFLTFSLLFLAVKYSNNVLPKRNYFENRGGPDGTA